MKIPASLGKAAEYATVAECERLNKIERKVKTLNKWIEERDELVKEQLDLVSAVKSRIKVDAQEA